MSIIKQAFSDTSPLIWLLLSLILILSLVGFHDKEAKRRVYVACLQNHPAPDCEVLKP